MSRKKTNPARIPVSISKDEARKLIENESGRMFLCSWALVLGALADRQDATSKSLLEFCEAVNGASSKPRSRKSIEARLAVLENLTGLPFPFHDLPIGNLRTKRDVERLLQKAGENSIHSAFALIADALLTHHIMSETDVCRLFQKAHILKEELFEQRIVLRDLLGVLEDEFGLRLTEEGSLVILQPIQ